MSISTRCAEWGQTFGQALTRAGWAGALALLCLTAPRAAFAHDDDAPATPEKFATGTALFVLVTLLVLAVSLRARLPARRRHTWSRYWRRIKRRRP